MKSPCLDCEVHKVGIDKNKSPECLNCNRRIQYVQAIEKSSPAYVVREFEQKISSGDNEKSRGQYMPTQICSQCEKEKTLDSDNFGRSKHSKNGYMGICKVCWGENIKKGRMKKKALKGNMKKEAEDKTGGKVLNIDLTDYPELYSLLLERSRIEIRPPENQIIYMLSKSLREEMPEV